METLWDPKNAGWSGITEIWSGNQDLGTKWSSKDAIKIPEERFAYCEPEGTFVVECEVGNNAYHMILLKNTNWGYLSINLDDEKFSEEEKRQGGSWPLSGDAEKDRFKLSKESLLSVHKSGVYVQGYDAVIKKILYIPSNYDPNIMWQGSEEFTSSWDDGKSLKIDKANFTKAGVYSVEFEAKNGAVFSVAVAANGWKPAFVSAQSVSVKKNSFEFTVDDEGLSLLKNHGMVLWGINMTAKKVRYVGPAPEKEKGLLWEGDTEFGSEWSVSQTVAAEKFSECIAKGTFALHFEKEGKGEVDLKFYYEDGGWKTLTVTSPNATANNDIFKVSTSPFTFKVDEENLSKMKEKSLIISGVNATLKKLVYDSGEIEFPYTKKIQSGDVIKFDLSNLKSQYVARKISANVKSDKEATVQFVLQIEGGAEGSEVTLKDSVTLSADKEAVLITKDLPAYGDEFSAKNCESPASNFPKNAVAKMVGIKVTTKEGGAEEIGVTVDGFKFFEEAFQAVDLKGLRPAEE